MRRNHVKARPPARRRGVGAAFLRAPPPQATAGLAAFPTPTPLHVGREGRETRRHHLRKQAISEIILLRSPLAPHPPDHDPAPCPGCGVGASQWRHFALGWRVVRKASCTHMGKTGSLPHRQLAGRGESGTGDSAEAGPPTCFPHGSQHRNQADQAT